ncbi:MAG TPA: universal stress protein [Elusimicrobiota bacterium]|nr:universal stress protein [Elusimicrobiota bacterium]HNG45450.1 universal stress protein [Elusimicrobiota bacterium]
MKKWTTPLTWLVGVDGSAHAERAARFALERAAVGGGTIRGVSIVPPLRRFPRPGEIAVVEALALRARTALDQWADRCRARGVRVETRALESDRPAEALLKEADRARASLVVVGARGLSPFKAFLMGSVSQRVVRRSRRPVLVVRGNPPPRGLRALVAVDGSSTGRRAIAFLKKIGLPAGSTVTAVHVVADPLALWAPEAGYGGGYPGGPFPLESRTELRRRGRTLLDKAVRDLRTVFPGARGRLTEGHPPVELLAEAKKARAHLVVLGARGLRGLDRFFLGSVSQQVLAHAESSVLIVP